MDIEMSTLYPLYLQPAVCLRHPGERVFTRPGEGVYLDQIWSDRSIIIVCFLLVDMDLDSEFTTQYNIFGK